MNFLSRSWIAALLLFSGATANVLIAMPLSDNENPPVHGINEMIQAEGWSEGVFGQYGWWLENQPANVTVAGASFESSQRSLFFNSESVTEATGPNSPTARGASNSLDEASLAKLESFRLNAVSGIITCRTIPDGPIQRCRIGVYGIEENLFAPNTNVDFWTYWLSDDSVALVDLELLSELSNGTTRG